MKVGDMVRFLDVDGATGVVFGYGEFSSGWWDILTDDGLIVSWPESQLEVISEA